MIQYVWVWHLFISLIFFILEIVDYKSPDSLKKMFLKNKCKHFLASEKIYPTVFAKTSTSPKNISIAGLSCKTNKTLVLLAMDSLLHYSFAERLGIDLNKQPDRSAVVILNDKVINYNFLNFFKDLINQYIIYRWSLIIFWNSQLIVNH